MKLSIGLVQTNISKSVTENIQNISNFINKSKDCDILLFPEGMLSGYYPEEKNYIAKLEKQDIDGAIEMIRDVIRQRQIETIIPTALKESSVWFNTSIWFDKNGEIKHIYKKCNLSNLDRKHFTAGNELQTYSLNGVQIGIQMCREVKYPDQWLHLKLLGANVIFHLNNTDTPRLYGKMFCKPEHMKTSFL